MDTIDIVTIDECDFWTIVDRLSDGQGVRYYDKYIYKADGRVWACYADNVNNRWEI